MHFVVRMGEERLLRRVMLGEMIESKNYSRGQEWDWTKDIEGDLNAFDIKFKGWPHKWLADGSNG